jgi:hypothetical protein
VQQPGDPEADHHGAVPGLHGEQRLRVHAGGQHLEQRRPVAGQAGGQRVQAGLVHRHQVGEHAVGVPAEQPAVGAQLRQVAPAQLAVPAEHGRVDQHRGAGWEQAAGSGPVYPAGHLVAEHPGPRDRDLAGGDL